MCLRAVGQRLGVQRMRTLLGVVQLLVSSDLLAVLLLVLLTARQRAVRALIVARGPAWSPTGSAPPRNLLGRPADAACAGQGNVVVSSSGRTEEVRPITASSGRVLSPHGRAAPPA